MKYFVTIGESVHEVELGPNGTTLDGNAIDPDLVEMDGTDVRSLLLGQKSHRILTAAVGKGEWSLHLSGRHLRAHVVDERTRLVQQLTGVRSAAPGLDALRAPMPGLVVKIDVEEGDRVIPGQGLVIVEAMKMENELKAESSALVKKVLVEPGQAVEKDQVLVEFTLDEPESGAAG